MGQVYVQAGEVRLYRAGSAAPVTTDRVVIVALLRSHHQAIATDGTRTADLSLDVVLNLELLAPDTGAATPSPVAAHSSRSSPRRLFHTARGVRRSRRRMLDGSWDCRSRRHTQSTGNPSWSGPHSSPTRWTCCPSHSSLPAPPARPPMSGPPAASGPGGTRTRSDTGSRTRPRSRCCRRHTPLLSRAPRRRRCTSGRDSLPALCDDWTSRRCRTRPRWPDTSHTAPLPSTGRWLLDPRCTCSGCCTPGSRPRAGRRH
eukprot:750733-Hanusia_phi.AAC.11